MAIPEMFNSSGPFIKVKGGSGLSLAGEESAIEGEDEKDPLIQTTINPHLSLAMEQGTAKHVGSGGPQESEEIPHVSIIAQAEGEDFQEFSPTSTECTYSRSYLLKRSIAKQTLLTSDTEDEERAATHRLLQRRLRRKHRRKPQRRRRRREEGEEPPIIQGLWVQEIDWSRSAADREAASGTSRVNDPLPAGVRRCAGRHGNARRAEAAPTDASRGRRGLTGAPRSSERGPRSDSSCGREDVGGAESVCTHESASDSSCGRRGVSDSVCSIGDVSDCLSSVLCVSDNFLVRGGVSDTTCSLMGVSASDNDSASDDSACSAEGESGSASSGDGVSDCSCGHGGVAEGVGGASDSDATPERGRVTQSHRRFVSAFFKELLRDAADETNGCVNEGLVFRKELRLCKSEYREGKEYHILHHIQNGSYGDVFCVQDKSTGFVCAAKRVPLGHFSSEEVSTWSALNSPRVVELFGAVREGLNITLFMDLKPGCLAQLLRERGSLPEDLALHYLRQLLGALEHLHLRHVLHLDVKVDNVLLSEDGMDAFLCDFGLSETLDQNGQSNKAFRGSGFPGTETHMAPEVARGDRRCAQADVWSSCCTLLHMLNGCHPWIRYYSQPLCLKSHEASLLPTEWESGDISYRNLELIVTEPAPLWEVPPSCNHFTAEVFRAGLQKDPNKRASASELKKKTTQALRAVGGLSCSSIEKPPNSETQNGDVPFGKLPTIPTAPVQAGAGQTAPTMQWVSPWRAKAAGEDSSDAEEGRSLRERDSESEPDSTDAEGRESRTNPADDAGGADWKWETDSEVDIYLGEEEYSREKRRWDYEGDWEEEEEEEESEWGSSSSAEVFHALHVHFPVLRKGLPTTTCRSWGSAAELEHLRDGVTVGSLAQSPSPEPRDHPPSCLSDTDESHIEVTDKDSDWSDDLSSGVFSSYNSQTDGHMEWLLSTNQSPSYFFEGVDVWIENMNGECLRIRERRQVKVGHVAIGISEQISTKAFSMETLDRKTVSFQQEIQESGLWLRCVPAPDTCQRWGWRIAEGRLEIRE